MNFHDQDQIEGQLAAYALGALDAEDRQHVESLLAASAAHREELRQLREVVALLPYATAPADPPPEVRERLLARVEADRAASEPLRLRPAQRGRPAWLVPVMGVALAALVLALAGLTFDLHTRVARLDQANRDLLSTVVGLQQSLVETQARQQELAASLDESQRQLGQVSEQLASSQEQVGQMSARVARDEYVISFVSAPGVATRQMAPADVTAGARGEMYMYPGETSAVAIFSGLPPLAPGQVYQFWLADGSTQVAGGTFQVDPTGLARIVVEAPREVNAFSQVMVTVEPAGGSPTPSQRVVLAGSL